MNLKNIFMETIKSKIGHLFTIEDANNFEKIIDYYETRYNETIAIYNNVYTVDNRDICNNQLQQKKKNKKQSEKIKEVLILLENFDADQVCIHTTRLSNEIEKILRGVSE